MEEEKKPNELKDVTKELIGWEDNKLFRTLNHLTTRPGQVITEFCRGDRQKYLSPIAYCFGVYALETFIATQIGFFDFIAQQNKESLLKSFSNPIFSKTGFNPTYIVDKINNNFSFFFSEVGQKIFVVPLILLLTWLFYKKINKSFKDNCWFALYTLGHATLLSKPFMLLGWYLTNDLIIYHSFSFLFYFGYWVWVSKQFYNLTLGKALLLRSLMMVTVQLVITLGFIVMMLIVVTTSKG